MRPSTPGRGATTALAVACTAALAVITAVVGIVVTLSLRGLGVSP